MRENVAKTAIAAMLAGAASYFGALLAPLIVLICVMLADYASGMAKAFITGTLSSRIGIKGIVKKVSYLLICCVGFAIDYIIGEALSVAGTQTSLPAIFGLIVIMWLILNELISILENLSVVGVDMPVFLIKLIKKLKITVEEKAEDTVGNEDEKS